MVLPTSIVLLLCFIGWFPFGLGREYELFSCPNSVSSSDFSTSLEFEDSSVERPWNEISGIAASPYQKGPSGEPIVWAHNDGRDRAFNGTNFAAFDSGTGDLIITFHLMFIDPDYPPRPNEEDNLRIYNQDWEDMTIGTCDGGEEICIYIADTGDNGATAEINGSSRPQDRPYTIYKVREPILEDFYPQNVVQLNTNDYVTALTIDYLDESSPFETRDVEAVFLDHTGWSEDGDGLPGDFYLVTLGRKDARLYKVPATAWPTQEEKIAHYSPKVVGSVYQEGLEFTSYQWRSSEMSFDGSKIVLGSVHRNHVFLRCPGQSVSNALIGPDSCFIFENPEEAADERKQFEAVAFLNDGGTTVLNAAEVRVIAPKLVKTTLEYNNPLQRGYCPSVAYVNNGNGTQICEITSDDGITTSLLLGQIRPDSWCDAFAEVNATPEPSSAPSLKPTNNPTAMPSEAPTSSAFVPARAINIMATLVTSLMILLPSIL